MPGHHALPGRGIADRQPLLRRARAPGTRRGMIFHQLNLAKAGMKPARKLATPPRRTGKKSIVGVSVENCKTCGGTGRHRCDVSGGTGERIAGTRSSPRSAAEIPRLPFRLREDAGRVPKSTIDLLQGPRFGLARKERTGNNNAVFTADLSQKVSETL